MKDKVILVTGGAGYIGAHTVKVLLDRGEKVIILDNLVTGHKKAAKVAGAPLIIGDVGDANLVESLFQKYEIESVVHFAAYSSVGESCADPLKYYDNNAAKPLNLLRSMHRHGCDKFILSSTCATYGEPKYVPMDELHPQSPINPYGMSKLVLEHALFDCEKAWGLRAVCLRYFNAAGSMPDGSLGEDHNPEFNLIPKVLQVIAGWDEKLTVFGTDYPTPDGTCQRDYIHVLDLADGHLAALDYLRGGGKSVACNLGTGLATSVKEIIVAAEKVTGQKVPVAYGDRRPGDPSILYASVGKAKSVLGWEAKKLDVTWQVESAWQFMIGPHKGRF